MITKMNKSRHLAHGRFVMVEATGPNKLQLDFTQTFPAHAQARRSLNVFNGRGPAYERETDELRMDDLSKKTTTDIPS